MPWVPASRTSRGYGSAPSVGLGLQGQQAHLGSVAVHDDEAVLRGQRGDRLRRDPDVAPLYGGGHRVRTPQQCVPAQCDHDPHSSLQASVSDRPQRSGGTGEGLAHLAALCSVDRYAEQQRYGGQEERGPVQPEGLAGVARVPDEQDGEHQREDGDGHVPDEATGFHAVAVGPAPLELCECREGIGDGCGDSGHEHERGEDVRATGPEVVDDYGDGRQHGRDHDAERRHPGAGEPLEPLREQTVLGRGQGHLGADHGPARECSEAGDDDGDGHQVARPGPAEDGVGRVGERGGRVGKGRAGEDAEHGGRARACRPRRWRGCPGWWPGGCSGRDRAPWRPRRRPSRRRGS